MVLCADKSEVVHLQVSAWGGYVFIINLIPLHVFTLLVMGRYSNRLFTSYTTFYILGLLLSMQIPFVGFQPIRTSEHMAASGNVQLLQLSLLFCMASTLLSVKERICIFFCSLFSCLIDIMLYSILKVFHVHLDSCIISLPFWILMQ